MKENINALDEVNKGASMGVVAIDFIKDKVQDKNFKKLLDKQEKTYKDISKSIEKIYKKYNEDDKPHKTNTIEKMMTYYGIEMRTFADDSDSKIAELLLKGTNMGIIEGRRIINHKEIDKEVNVIIENFVNVQEEYVECLKEYL